MRAVERGAETVVEHSRLVVVLALVATVVMVAGAGAVESTSSMSGATTDSTVVEANDYVSENFSRRDGNTSTALFAVREADGNVLDRASLLATLRFQQRLRANETVTRTLVDERPTVGVANVVATAAIRARQARNRTGGADRSAAPVANASAPPLSAQIDRLESMSDAEVEATVERVLGGEGPAGRAARQLLPQDYDGGPTAEASLVVVTQHTGERVRTGAETPQDVADGQVAARAIARRGDGPDDQAYLAFGRGFMTEQQDQALADSFSILGPAALLFVLVALSIAYRDPLDVALGLAGVVVVLIWMFGVLGWVGIAFNQVMIAVPLLLIGLSVDYALHVVMRYRERRERTDESSREAMAAALGGVGTALALVTITTAVGFLANLASPMPDLRWFGVVTAVGIGCAFLVFGVALPALKADLDTLLSAHGFDRDRRAFGTVGRFLAGGVTLARRAPLAVLAVALLLSVAGASGATTVQPDFAEEDFLADDPPAWTSHLGPLEPGDYYLKDNREYVYSQFQTPDKQVQVLVRGNVTRPDSLERVAAAERRARNASVTHTRADGEAPVTSPLSAMARVAERNATFNATLAAADTDGDGVPDRDLQRVYDAFWAADADLADRYLHRTDDGYAALRLRAFVVGTAESEAIYDEMHAVAATVETGEAADGGSVGDAGPGPATDLDATATGGAIVERVINTELSRTVVGSLVATLVAVLALLAAVFRLTEGSATLGVVTLVPVVFTVAWLFGTMALLDLSITLITAVVGSITLGLGVDYAIHVSERFGHELADAPPAVALERTVTGTGGALASSAVTTAAGFGVLGLSLLPALRQFGFLLATGIVYAFLASVFVLPSLLVLWARYGPVDRSTDVEDSVAGVADD